MKKVELSPKSIVIPILTGSFSTVINRTYLKEINPTLKHGGSILLGSVLTIFSKNKLIKQSGIGLIISNSAELIHYNATKKNNCTFEFRHNIAESNKILINLNSGRIIQNNENKQSYIYLTRSNNTQGWSNSFKLKYCLNISGNYGGLASRKGMLVQWSRLQDHKFEFNKLLEKWMQFFELKKREFNTNSIDYAKKIWYWRFMVNDYKPLDIKNSNWSPKYKGKWSIYNKTLVRYDDYGNILYGAAGTAFGLDERTLLAGANINQFKKTGFDDEKDAYSIQRGIAFYKKMHKTKIE